MKNKFLITILIFFLGLGSALYAQEQSSEIKLTLKDAQDYALNYNKSIKSAKYDVEASKLAIWDIASGALPQINATGGIIDNLKLRTMLMPGKFFGDTTGRYYPITFGQQYNTSLGFQANLLLFNGPLYIGIQTTKLANMMSEMNLTKTEIDIKESVASSYYLILISEESLRIINENLDIMNELLKSTQALYKVGMAESTDVDQMLSNVTMMDNTKSSMERAIEVNYNLLRLLLGVKPDTKIVLSETLVSITGNINIEALAIQEFDYRKNINYQMMESQEKMNELALKSKKSSILPTIAGYYSYSTEGQGNQFFHQMYYPNSMLGLQISIPLLASGQRYIAIKKAQVSLMKAHNSKEQVVDQLLLQEKQLRFTLINANLQYNNQKNNIAVARRVYNSTENKFKQGMASSLDLTQANSLYVQAENSYISALMNLLQTKLALDKLLNNL
jgi:outer membrane protein